MHTIWVDEWNKVEVIAVHNCLDLSIVGEIAVDELPCVVLLDLWWRVSAFKRNQKDQKTDWSCNPLASMDSGMEVDRRLLAFAACSPEVNAINITALVRLSGDEDFRVRREGCIEIVEE